MWILIQLQEQIKIRLPRNTAYKRNTEKKIFNKKVTNEK